MRREDAEAVYELVTRVVSSAVVGLHNGVIHPESATKIREARRDFMAKADTRFTEARLTEYERILRMILDDINVALGVVDSGFPSSRPFGLDYRSLQHMITEALK